MSRCNLITDSFVLGENLKVISNKNKFINLQERCRGYSSIRMSHLPGSYVTVEYFSPTEVLVIKDRLEYYLHPETLEMYTSLFDAVSKEEEEKLSKLLQYENVNAQNEFGQTPIHLACSLGHINIVKLLCKFNPDLNIPDHKGDFPIHTIVDLKHYDIIKYLKERFPDILNVKNSKGQSVHDIAENKNDEILNNLISIKLQTIELETTESPEALPSEPPNYENESDDTSVYQTLSMQSRPVINEPEVPDSQEYFPDELTCGICTFRRKNTILVCGHIFCRECSRRLPICPHCREITKVFTEMILK